MPRHTGIVSLAILSIMVMVFVIACGISPRCAKWVGLESWSLPAIREWLTESEARAARLQEQKEQLFQEIEFCNHLIARLIDGSMTLEYAADAWEPIIRNRPGFMDDGKLNNGVVSARRGVARDLISRIEVRLDNDSRWASVSARLEAEYAGLK
jgi:hypothetical protein